MHRKKQVHYSPQLNASFVFEIFSSVFFFHLNPRNKTNKKNKDIQEYFKTLTRQKHWKTHTHTKLESNSAFASHINMKTRTICNTQIWHKYFSNIRSFCTSCPGLRVRLYNSGPTKSPRKTALMVHAVREKKPLFPHLRSLFTETGDGGFCCLFGHRGRPGNSPQGR